MEQNNARENGGLVRYECGWEALKSFWDGGPDTIIISSWILDGADDEDRERGYFLVGDAEAAMPMLGKKSDDEMKALIRRASYETQLVRKNSRRLSLAALCLASALEALSPAVSIQHTVLERFTEDAKWAVNTDGTREQIPRMR